jgi:gamma-glutamylcyclotransferase (GGCT)/AIG2-like uncharacterized protein YtfP
MEPKQWGEGSGPLQPFDDKGHQAQGTGESQEKSEGHRLGSVAIIINSKPEINSEPELGDALNAAAPPASMIDPNPPMADPTADIETLLFVYGTLKRGQPNHGRLQGARCLGLASLQGACLFDLGPFPMAIAGEGRVAGELYAVASADLPDLDAFEGCPRLYQRHWLPLTDGRHAWVYLGQPRQVRHVPQLVGGQWPADGRTAPIAFLRSPGLQRWGWACALLWLLQPLAVTASAFDTLAACQAWRSSHGLARLELANAIGAAHYLTKRHAFQESTQQAPVELYSPADIQRVCGRS